MVGFVILAGIAGIAALGLLGWALGGESGNQQRGRERLPPAVPSRRPVQKRPSTNRRPNALNKQRSVPLTPAKNPVVTRSRTTHRGIPGFCQCGHRAIPGDTVCYSCSP